MQGIFLTSSKYQLWIAPSIFLKLCLVSGSYLYFVALIRERLLDALNNWTNKAVKTQKYELVIHLIK